MKTPVLEKVLWWLVVAAMVLPLVTWPQALNPFHIGKVLSFRVLVEMMAVLWVAAMMRNPRLRPFGKEAPAALRWTPITIAVLAMTASFALSTVVAADRAYALWGTIERMGGLFSFLHYTVFFFILISLVATRGRWETLWKAVIAVGVLSSLYGLAQWLDIRSILGVPIVGWQRESAIGTAGNAAMQGGYLLFPIFWALYFTVRPGVSRRAWYIAAIALMAFVLALTATRAPIGGLFIGTLVALGIVGLGGRSLTERRVWLKQAALALFAVGVVGISLAFVFRASPFVQRIPVLQYVDTIRLDNTTFQTRFWTWQSVWNGIKERPALGWGPDNLFIPFNQYFNPLHFHGFGSETWFDRAHNLFFDLAATQGVVGVSAAVFLFFALFRAIGRASAVRAGEDGLMFKALMAGLVVAYLVHLSMLFDVFLTYFMATLLLAYMNWESVGRRAEEGASVVKESRAGLFRRSLTPLQSVAVLALAVVAAFMAWSWNVQVARADYATTRALIATRNNLNGAIERFDRAIAFDAKPGRMEARLKLAQFTAEVLESGGLRDKKTLVSEADKERLLRFTEEHIRRGVELHPLDAQHIIFLGRMQNFLAGFYDEPQKLEESIAVLQRGVALSPTRQRMVFELAQSLVIAGKREEALALFDQTVQANPEVGVAYWYRGVVRNQLGDTAGALADIRIAEEKGYDLYDDHRDILRLINIYVDVGNLVRVAELYEEVVRLVPNNPQYWASLAETYRQLGRYADARRAALTAAQIAPAFAPQVQEFLRSLPQ